MKASLNHKFNKLTQISQSSVYYVAPQVSDQILELQNKYESSLYEFAKAAWKEVDPDNWIDSWHIHALAEHLEALYKKDITYLLINIPPRMGKSLMANVFFPAWAWAKDPTKRMFYTSYSHDLATRHHKWNRDLIGSKWYKEIWGNKYMVRPDSDNQKEFINDKMGFRMLASIGGKSTGYGSEYLFCDDPNKAGKDAESITIRDTVNNWWGVSMSTRFSRASSFARCISMQRLHIMDLSGFVLAQEIPELVHLYLPMEYESSRKCSTIILPSTKGIKWSDPRKKEGELICPELIDTKVITTKKAELGTYGWAGQYQQRPSPEAGGLFKKDWFSWWCEDFVPECEIRFQSWDTALSTQATACYSACTTWGLFKDKGGIPNLILLSLWQEKVEYPDLRIMAQRLANNYLDVVLHAPLPEKTGKPIDFVLIEYASTGGPLVQDMRKAGIPIKRFLPKNFGSKAARVAVASALVEGGRIWLPAKGPNFTQLRNYAEKFQNACVLYPNDISNDVVDSMTQAVLYTYRTNEISHPDNPVHVEQYNVKATQKKW